MTIQRRFVLTLVLLFGLCTAHVQISAQQNPPAETYKPAIELLPDSVAGMVRIPNLPRFCEAWEKTSLGKLVEDEAMQPFIEAQRKRAKNYLEAFDNKVGVRPEDLYNIASGELVVSWLPFANDKRRPFALCVIADVRGRAEQAEVAIEKLDKDLKVAGWIRKDIEHQGQTVRIYNTEPKPGQLKVEQIVISLDETRLLAADRDLVVTDLLDTIAGDADGSPIIKVEEFQTILKKSSQAILEPVKKGGGTIAIEWFARPFQMARILKESLDVDRGNQVDIVKLLENQGFDAVKAAGGILALAGDKYQMLHRGSILAPPVTDKPSKYKLAARMLQFENAPLAPIPAWVHSDSASFSRINLRFEEIFWASETLLNEAFGDEIFQDIIEGIKEDEDGPQIDIAKNVLPNLDDQLILITDNTLPSELNSERMLIAIRVSDSKAIGTAISKAMEVEPDASIMDAVPGVDIWRVQRGGDDDDLDEDLFGDLDIGLGEDEIEESPPLLDHWAIAMIDKGANSEFPYLMFSNDPDMLVAAATRIRSGTITGLSDEPEIKAIVAALKELGCTTPAMERVVRTKLSFRAKYNLLREGKLKDSDSVLSSFYRRFLEDQEAETDESINATDLPPLSVIEKYLPSGGGFSETTEDGWSLTGFLLNQ
ncbi:membrane or secreted protein [Rhodopirellula sp.]|nr:membrane or secreted protein [Rhodopirellula sp.]MDA7915370.1 membrane or secreted protein [bacterium]MDA7904857.1 membrane or secreted protein [Rhodopirellula sp.]MDA8968274.1 membrane or secreted protein [bacterium]MDB4477067.1 membrane or secreted protein [Rhodopirellula sp.]